MASLCFAHRGTGGPSPTLSGPVSPQQNDQAGRGDVAVLSSSKSSVTLFPFLNPVCFGGSL